MPRDHTNKSKNSRNLAEQLGLHAPFCSLANRNEDVRIERQRESGRRKRIRRLSITSSFLEPAGHRDNTRQNLRSEDSARADKGQRGRQQRDGFASSPPPSIIISSPEQPVKPYERRKRRKTREDRYELKQGEWDKSQRSGEKARGKPRKKKKRLQKSGSALMQDFTAGNVKPERLTLKAAAPLGLFGKGRASSPIKRKGLPDLTFSEINFLSHRKEDREGKLDTVEKNTRRKKDKAADTEAEISRFFASSKDQEQNTGDAAKRRGSDSGKKRQVERMDEQQRSSLPPVDLPERPFLGFGTCGPGHNSPMAPASASVSHGDGHVSLRRRSPPSRSTSYYTWSRSSLSQNRRFRELKRSSGHSCEAYRVPQDTADLGARADGSDSSSPARIHFDSGDISCTPSTRLARSKRGIEDNEADDGKVPVPSTSPRYKPGTTAQELHKVVPDEGPESQLVRQKQGHSKTDPEDRHMRTVDSKADWPSILAGFSRPEILGAVLDALLNNKTFESRRSPRPSEIVGSRGVENTRRSESKHETQIPHEPAHSGTSKPPHTDPGQFHATHATASSKPCQDGRQALPLSGSNPQKADQRPGGVSDVQDSISFGEGFQTRKQQETLYHDASINQVPQVTQERPELSNALIGYQNLYQGQRDEAVVRPQENNVNEDHQDYSQIMHSIHETPEGFPDHRDMVEEDHLYDPYPDLQRLPRDRSNPTHHGTSHSYSGPHEPYQELQDEMLDVELNHQGGLSQDARASLLMHSEGIDIGQYFDGRVENHPRFPTIGFLGGRGFATVDAAQVFSPWSSRTPSATQNRDVLSSTTGVGAMEEVSLARFWKPNRLY
ncbi:MAG: hypothetical protein Q9201_006548 [Fulgogasparrea decipioides]